MLSAWIEDSESKELLHLWSDAIDVDLIHLGTLGDSEEIKDTANAQPLIVAAGLLGAKALRGSGEFKFVAGHSVGEITAAALSGAISELDAMKLVRVRGLEMAKAAGATPSGMAAVLGGDRKIVLRAIADLGLVAANDNGAGQIVAAGDLDAIAQLAPEGARVRALAVAGAFHTNFMESAVAPLRAIAASIQVSDTSIGVISNRDGDVITHGREILDRIVAQISNPVRWDLCMSTLKSLDVSGALEVPPAGTLVGLLKRAEPVIETFALKSPSDLVLAREFATRHQYVEGA
jgi:[acyl-carrier-protein] S-malonyltransferase